eukprot:5723885-Amphidinium_carterae.1
MGFNFPNLLTLVGSWKMDTLYVRVRTTQRQQPKDEIIGHDLTNRAYPIKVEERRLPSSHGKPEMRCYYTSTHHAD